jgi:hypothetical protein
LGEAGGTSFFVLTSWLVYLCLAKIKCWAKALVAREGFAMFMANETFQGPVGLVSLGFVSVFLKFKGCLLGLEKRETSA